MWGKQWSKEHMFDLTLNEAWAGYQCEIYSSSVQYVEHIECPPLPILLKGLLSDGEQAVGVAMHPQLK